MLRILNWALAAELAALGFLFSGGVGLAIWALSGEWPVHAIIACTVLSGVNGLILEKPAFSKLTMVQWSLVFACAAVIPVLGGGFKSGAPHYITIAVGILPAAYYIIQYAVHSSETTSNDKPSSPVPTWHPEHSD